MAYVNVKPETREAMDRILGKSNFSTSCVWPDQILRRYEEKDGEKIPAHWNQHNLRTAEWHFLDLKKDSTVLGGMRSDTEESHFNIIQALISAEDHLRRDCTEELMGAKDSSCSDSLKFLAHFVGDIHQPLHLGVLKENGRPLDYGGNSIKVKVRLANGEIVHEQEYRYWQILENGVLEKTTKLLPVNLHSVWDLHLLEYTERAAQVNDLDFKTFTRFLLNNNDDDISNWKDQTFLEWAQESLELRKEAYQLNGVELVKTSFKDKDNPDAWPAIDLDYVEAQKPVVVRRLLQAGHRLAWLLDRIFDNKTRIQDGEMRKKIADHFSSIEK